MTDELVHLTHADTADGRVATLTLDSPGNRNALSRRLVTELLDHLATTDADDTVTVVVLRSAHRVFCSGADLSEAATVPMEEGARAVVEVQRRIVAHSKPVVVVLPGPVRAGGIGIVAAADVVVASTAATFALTEVKLGVTPAVISLTVLPRLTDRAASLAALGGEVFDGAQAAAYGLVTTAVAPEELDAEVDRVVGSLLTGAPQGLAATKALLNAPLLARIDAEGEAMVELSARLFRSDAAREAMTAWFSRSR
ncbi:enoyl-CoA hydratase/carnithine racemase [Nocardioides zeae]|uniref:Enoyl-CoA hydratase/carnithine racemase n=2 Tax=Nocardioides zeae TaxID=1457234 RepID=A0ACC6IIG7_9ACTN|nr:enoyl-CoA hydratase-related protein [Nocardioides zeae]MDQ1105899.1 enoyl-CoA hydratase/carnithine racemase [Nocardioides zeae]MDR6174456.1 enoyl-CoA hydratase/carnithine racemase [Nocardioides zeae]MDR6210528.1 enoyl-CoA hydratase/carnithine racemase [Nocardioides zeae]